MRNFEERKAEIFRRSENRIKERKRNRNRILALCVPLCLCIVIMSVIYLPDIMVPSDKSNSTEDINTTAPSCGTSGCVYTSLDITCNSSLLDYEKKETDTVNIKNIYNIIQSAFADEADKETVDTQDKFPETQKGEDANGGNTNGENHSSSQPSEITTQNSSKGLLYTITFKSNDGMQTIYTLDGNLLVNESTKQEVTLSDSQMSELQKALGWELTWEEESN